MEVAPRALTPTERALVVGLVALNRLPPLADQVLGALQVVGRCDCGCASVDLEPDEGAAQVLGEGFGVTPGRIPVGVTLWERGTRIVGLEVYMLGNDTAELPMPESLTASTGTSAS